jgi:hypothetical protein
VARNRTSSLAPAVTAKAAGDLGEVGRSGLLISNGIVFEEFLPQLRGATGRRVYREMADNDPIVGGLTMAAVRSIGRLDWHIEKDADEDADQAAEDAAQFVQEALDDMSEDWPSTLHNIMSCHTYGWSYLEIVYKRRNGSNDNPGQSSNYDDGRIGWRKWAPRSQETLLRWLTDDAGGVQGMGQQTIDGYFEIPIEKALLFRTSTERNNPEGRSMLRNAYRPWFFKKRIEEIEAIGIERDLAGLPIVKMAPKYFSPNASADERMLMQQMQSLVQNVKRNQTEGIVFPLAYDQNNNKTIDIELLSTGGTRNFDTDKIIARYNQQIAMSVLADFMLLGHENVGSHALGASKIELWMMTVEAIAESIAQVINTHAIPRLLKLNGMQTDKMPKLVYGSIENVNLSELGIFLKQAADAGLLIPDAGLEEYIRDVADLPPIDQSEREDMYGVDYNPYGKQPVPPQLVPEGDPLVITAEAQHETADTAADASKLPPAPAGDGLPADAAPGTSGAGRKKAPGATVQPAK